jgi:ankyrin repeat protein
MLIEACRSGDSEAVQWLLDTCDQNTAMIDGCTPLHIACENGHIEVARLLVEAGADKDKVSTDGSTPLYVACEQGHIEVVQLLVEAGSDTEKALADGCTPLYVACECGHTKVAQLLVEAGADKEKASTSGYTPLLVTCHNGYVDVVRLLVEAGADKENASADGCEPLLIACENGHNEVARLLLEAGADKERASTDGWTPLLIACENGRIEVARLLLEAGAEKENANANGWTPLIFACKTDHIAVVQLLLEAGADKDKANANGQTALHIAASRGHDTICMLLAFKGADLTARASNNQTPADMAQDSSCFYFPALAAHLRNAQMSSNSNGVHCLRCTGPSLERRLLWDDTNQQQQEAMLDDMQAQWLARVAEGCAHARVGLTLRGAFNGGLPTDMLLCIMGYVFDGTLAHLQSCISTGQVAPERGLAMRAAAAVDAHGAVMTAESASAVPATKRAKHAGADSGGPMQESAKDHQEQLPPKLALVSHALALNATPKSQPISSCSIAVLTRLGAATHTVYHTAEGGCEWLQGYCDFLQRRHFSFEFDDLAFDDLGCCNDTSLSAPAPNFLPPVW